MLHTNWLCTAKTELVEISRCRNCTTIQIKGVKGICPYLPHVLTEQNVYMFMTVGEDGDLMVNLEHTKVVMHLVSGLSSIGFHFLAWIFGYFGQTHIPIQISFAIEMVICQASNLASDAFSNLLNISNENRFEDIWNMWLAVWRISPIGKIGVILFPLPP